MIGPKYARALVGLLFLAAAWQAGSAGWIVTKAAAAQALLERAWARSEGGTLAVRPWPWADTWPVARLRLGGDQPPLLVLDGASGRNLAFGPARVLRSPWPGQGRGTLIAGHRDTHFGSLRTLRAGDGITLERGGRKRRYQVAQTGVVHQDASAELERLPGEGLVLVTCYPFDAVDPGTEWRYVVWARPVDSRNHLGPVYPSSASLLGLNSAQSRRDERALVVPK